MNTIRVRSVGPSALPVVAAAVVSPGGSSSLPEARLSPLGRRVLAVLRELGGAGGEVSEARLKGALPGVDVAGALLELHSAWLVLAVPGRGGGRNGRERRLLVVEQGRAPGPGVRARHAAFLSGQSGTLSGFAGRLGLTRGDALGVMRLLVEHGHASGGPVVATFVFRVRVSSPAGI